MLDPEIIRPLVKAGISSTDIAKQLNSTPRKIQQFVKDNNLGPWASRTKTLKHDKLAIPADFAENAKTMTHYALEAHYRRSYGTISKWFEATGIERLRTAKNRMPDNFDELVKTKTIKEISEQMKCGRDAVRRMIKASGATKARIPAKKLAVAKPTPAPKPVFRRPMGSFQAPLNPYQRDMSAEGRAQDILQSDRWIVFRCDENGRPNTAGKFWICGSRRVTGAELLERAERTARKLGRAIPWQKAA